MYNNQTNNLKGYENAGTKCQSNSYARGNCGTRR